MGIMIREMDEGVYNQPAIPLLPHPTQQHPTSLLPEVVSEKLVVKMRKVWDSGANGGEGVARGVWSSSGKR